MTQTSWPWDGTTTGDATLAPYDDDEWTDIWRKLFQRDRTTEGVIKGFLNELVVTNPSGDTIRMASGSAIVDGKFYENDANADITVSGDGTYRAVLQKSWASQTVRFAVLSGASVTQTDGVTWEIKLADVVRNGGFFTLTDQRVYTHFNTLVSSTMLDDASVTDNKVGAGIPTLPRRFGGSATDWNVSGSTGRTVGKSQIMVGMTSVSILDTNSSVSGSVTFDAFQYEPLGFVQADTDGVTDDDYNVIITSITTTTIGFKVYRPGTSGTETVRVHWMAIGPRS